MKKKDQGISNYISEHFGIDISPFLQNMILNHRHLNNLNNTALKQIVIEFAPIYQYHMLDGPDWLADFKFALFCRVMNKHELLQLLETNLDI